MTVTRQVTWGEALVVAGFRTTGGLKAAVERIHAAVGSHIGTRNTFAKLYKVSDPDELSERDHLRAWLLLTALGEDPADWGISDGGVPRAYELPALREALKVTYGYPNPDVGMDWPRYSDARVA